MTKTLENFRPKLRAGRMIPHGSKFTFEMKDPYEKLTLPMIMADFVLLCGGQFTIREIAEKIYRKQGTVPFRALLETLYLLHARGFLENSEVLNEQPWLSKQQLIRKRLHIDFQTNISVLGPSPSSIAFYLLALALISASIAGFVFDWRDPFGHRPVPGDFSILFFIGLFIGNSCLLTGKNILRALQILVLNGRVGSFSIRISPWAIYLRTTDTLNETSNDRLFNTLFHTAQLFAPFTLVLLTNFYFRENLSWLYMLTFYLTFWELSPFRRTEFFNLLRAIMLPERLDPLAFLGTGINPRHQRFVFACSFFGLGWIALCLRLLASAAERYGVSLGNAFAHGSPSEQLGAVLGAGIWLGAVFLSVHSFVETASAVIAEQLKAWRARIVRGRRTSTPVHSEKWVLETLRQLPIFAHLSDDGLQRLVTGSELLWVEENTPVIVAGEESRDLFVLFEGNVIIQKGVSPAPILPVTIFGESALVENGIRSADVSTTSRCLILKVPVSTLRLIARDSHVIGEIDSFMTAIMVDQFFASAPLFRKLPREGIDYLSARGALEFTQPGDTVFKQGDQGEYFYMVIRGKVRVEVNGRGIKTINQGGFFGEISLIANIPRTASIISAEPSVLFKISSDAFWEVLVQHLEMAVFIEKVGEQRLQEDLQMIRKTG